MAQGVTIDFSANLARFSGQIDKAVQDLNKFQSNAQRVGSKVKVVLGGIGAGLSVGAFTASVIKTTAEYEKLNASLKSVTGSQIEATRAMELVKGLASDTPFSVQQLTESFIKLKSLGLEPSEEALISYGNTASAMGKDLNQMIEAVAEGLEEPGDTENPGIAVKACETVHGSHAVLERVACA